MSEIDNYKNYYSSKLFTIDNKINDMYKLEVIGFIMTILVSIIGAIIASLFGLTFIDNSVFLNLFSIMILFFGFQAVLNHYSDYYFSVYLYVMPFLRIINKIKLYKTYKNSLTKAQRKEFKSGYKIGTQYKLNENDDIIIKYIVFIKNNKMPLLTEVETVKINKYIEDKDLLELQKLLKTKIEKRIEKKYQYQDIEKRLNTLFAN